MKALWPCCFTSHQRGWPRGLPKKTSVRQISWSELVRDRLGTSRNPKNALLTGKAGLAFREKCIPRFMLFQSFPKSLGMTLTHGLMIFNGCRPFNPQC